MDGKRFEAMGFQDMALSGPLQIKEANFLPLWPDDGSQSSNANALDLKYIYIYIYSLSVMNLLVWQLCSSSRVTGLYIS